MAGDSKARVVLEAVRRGDTAFSSLQSDLGKLAQRAAVVGAAAAAALAVVTKRAFENIDALAKQADVLAISTEKLAALQLSAKLAGVENEQLNKALERQRQTIFDASNGVQGASRALEQLGLKTEDLLKLNTYDQFLAIAESISKVENATVRGGLAADVFGERGTDGQRDRIREGRVRRGTSKRIRRRRPKAWLLTRSSNGDCEDHARADRQDRRHER